MRKNFNFSRKLNYKKLVYNKKVKLLFIIIFLILGLFIWSVFIEPNILTVKKLSVKDDKLKGLKIVFASDFHIKPYEKYRIQRTVKAINKQNADIVLLGGDFVNGHDCSFTMPVDEIAFELSKIRPKTYAVIGNHDGWQGKSKVISSLEKNKIKVLLNENICFEKFCIAGVDDMQTGKPDLNKALNNVKQPVILLSHTPDIMPDVPDSVNLTLCGHLHGGQIRLNRALIVPSAYGLKYADGFVNDNGKKVYTSKGLGTSILPVRLNCPPEIVVIEFI